MPRRSTPSRPCPRRPPLRCGAGSDPDVPRHLLQPGAELGPRRHSGATHLAAGPGQGRAAPDDARGRSRPAWTGSSCPITAVGRSKTRWPRSMRSSRYGRPSALMRPLANSARAAPRAEMVIRQLVDSGIRSGTAPLRSQHVACRASRGHAPHSREASPMAELNGRAPRSAAIGSARSRSFGRDSARGGLVPAEVAGRAESLLTPERLRRWP
jgi:hypothetical protein